MFEHEFELEDVKFMKRALVLAKRGIGYVNPNPPVGAVIVKDGAIVSEGYHERYGGFHAERNAILRALERGVDLSGTTMYVTLEPCDHYGKTPPCTDLIIEAGIRRVIVACRDPNPVSGDGISKLRNAGIHVAVGLLESEAKEVMKFFMKSVVQKLPYVTLKYASSLDGKIADRGGNSKWITNELRKIVHKLRKEHMAVLVGAGTVLKDNPQLNIRLVKSKKRAPIKVILDWEGKTLRKRAELNVYSPESKVIVFSRLADYPVEEHIRVINVREPIEILKTLWTLGVDSILVEGGAEVFSQFLPYADEIYAFYGLKVLGDGKGIFSGISNTIATPFEYCITKTVVAKNRSEFLVVMKRCSQG
ncbi:bifunctional diaminohydroxyphosphoribosylaminopyrimidine deaminase/5-amino-6-(5-phosphoribosylamino)uracil reductase RibD [Fervidobacterium thailandense]|nr:bifunctional diaminohydroxyphosphoribosylaminopyrimidine deaminase/5-amino-6-(5-phosphoribosylamino)uracil reductase RibD [Fervidobacterium thailandense]